LITKLFINNHKHILIIIILKKHSTEVIKIPASIVEVQKPIPATIVEQLLPIGINFTAKKLAININSLHIPTKANFNI